MIKFFRHIRHSLIMETGKTTRYFKYAIGEIILVVIGILIALSINNWNQDRIAQLQEHKLFREILLDLKSADTLNKNMLKSMNNYQNLNIQIFSEIRNKAVYDSTHMYHDLWWYSTYNAIISENHSDNLSSITNESVRDALGDYIKHENIIVKGLTNWDNLKIETVRPYINQYGIKNVDTIFNRLDFKFRNVNDRTFDMFNYDKLKSQYGSEELDQLLASVYMMTGYVILKLEEQQKYIEELDNILEEELND